MSTTAQDPFALAATAFHGVADATKAAAAATVKPELTPVMGPPEPLFTRLGSPAPMSVPEFNQRLETVTQQHVQQFGVKPSPQDALNAVFTGQPTFTPLATQAQQALALHPVLTDKQFLKQFSLVAANAGNDKDSYTNFVHDNEQRITDLQKNKATAVAVNGIVNRAVSAQYGTPKTGEQITGSAGIAKADVGSEAGSIVARGIGQIVDSLVHSPGGLYAGITGVGKDVFDAGKYVGSGGQEGSDSFKRTKAVAGGMYHQVGQDIHHPAERPGYLFLDVLGFGSLGGGALARGAEATRAARAGEGVSGAVKGLASKPPLRTAPLRIGDYTEQMPLSSNPTVAFVQQRILNARQSATDRRLTDGPSPIRSVWGLQSAWDFIDQHLSFERKVGREADARMRVEHVAQQSLVNELRVAAGSSIAHSNVLGKIGFVAKKGLTRGEQKAIQAASWDVEGDVLDKIHAEEDFHHSMIAQDIGSARAHRAQIADLALARKAVEAPSERFAKAFDLTQRVVAEMQRQKIEELGLAPLTAEGRLAKTGQVLREEPVTGGARTSEDSFYLPTQPRGKVKRGPSQVRGRFGVSPGPYGVSPGRDMPELTHAFEGDAMRAGNIRIDATNLAAEAYARTARAITVKNQWRKLWDSSASVKRTQWDAPIRDANNIPDRLREIVAKLDEGILTQKDADLLPQDMADLLRSMFPLEHDLAPEEIPHVRWYDSRITGSLEGAPSRSSEAVAKLFQTFNSPFRFTALYLRPAYALNLLGNHAMLAFDQGFLTSVQNIARALNLKNTDSAENVRMMRDLVGAGKSQSFVASASGHISQAIAHWWNNFADRDERIASFLYYADRKGYKTPEARHALLNDPANKGDLVEVTRRANKALVEFDNLTPIEKNVIRHIIFVYPWVRGSAVWSLRAVMEHPARTAILSQLGREEIQHDPILSKAPEWFRKIGYFPVGWAHDGNPLVVNPTSVNTFSTIGDFLNIGRAGSVGSQTFAAEDLLGPAAKLFIHAATGRDDYGNRYPDGQWIGAAKDILKGLPQSKYLGLTPPSKASKQQPVPFKITDRASLSAHDRSLMHQTVFGPGWLDGYGTLIAGGFSPREANAAGLAARAESEKDLAARLKTERGLIDTALGLQGEFVGTPVPKGVRQAVNAHFDMTARFAAFHKQTGRTMTAKEKAGAWIGYLAARKLIPAGDVAKLTATLKGTSDDEINLFQNALIDKYASGRALRQWDADVRALYSFKHKTFDEKASTLHAAGLAPQASYRNRPQADLYAYGRGFLKYQAGLRDLKARKAPASDVRLYIDEHAKPVNGFPSYAAIAWANQTPQERAHALVTDSTSGWGTLTSVQKQLVGRPVDPAVTEAWHAYQVTTSTSDPRSQVPRGTRLDANQRLSIAKQLDRYYGLHGKFISDYLFAQEPLSQRLERLRIVRESAHRSEWDALLTNAGQVEARVKAGTLTQTDADNAWRDYARQLEAWYPKNEPGFWRSELGPIVKGDKSFLERLVRR